MDKIKRMYERIEKGVVGTYRKIERGTVRSYKKIEHGAVSGYLAVEDFFVKRLFAREGESAAQAKERLRG